jgi:hypothetical protein
MLQVVLLAVLLLASPQTSLSFQGTHNRKLTAAEVSVMMALRRLHGQSANSMNRTA